MRARRPAASSRPPGRRLASVLVASATALAGLSLAAPSASAAPRPAASAPGGLISYVAYAGGAHQVFTMKPDGSEQRQRTFNPTGTKKCDPMLNPNNPNEVVYAASDGGMYVHALGTLADGAGDTITAIAPPTDERGGGRRPTFSADGNTVVFHYSLDADLAPALAVYDLYMTNRQPDGTWSAARPITALAAGQSAFHPRYSLAGGDWLAYTFRADPTAQHELHVAKVPASATTPTTAPGTSSGALGTRVPQATGALLATWSKNGDRLGYVKSCAAAVEYVTVTYADSAKVALPTFGAAPVAVAQSGGCGLSWSSTSNDHLVYADTGKIFVKDVSGTRKAVAIGTGGMPSW